MQFVACRAPHRRSGANADFRLFDVSISADYRFPAQRNADSAFDTRVLWMDLEQTAPAFKSGLIAESGQ